MVGPLPRRPHLPSSPTLHAVSRLQFANMPQMLTYTRWNSYLEPTTSPTTTPSTSPTSTPEPAADDSKAAPVGAIVGGTVGGIAVIAIAVAAIWWFCIRKRRRPTGSAAEVKPVVLQASAELSPEGKAVALPPRELEGTPRNGPPTELPG